MDNLEYRIFIKECQKIVVKVGTSTLSYPNGRLNFQRIESLATVISGLQQSGKQLILVSSGAIAAGSGRMGIKEKPADLAEKQALAALGQTGLMKIYQKFFEIRGQQVAQVLKILGSDGVVVPKMGTLSLPLNQLAISSMGLVKHIGGIIPSSSHLTNASVQGTLPRMKGGRQ